MAAADPDARTDASQWHRVTLALLGGLAVASVLFAHVAVVQTPGLDPPPESAALFVVAAATATVGYLLVREDSDVGYPAGMLAGLVVLVAVSVVAVGTYGPAGSRTNPVGPVVYVGLSLAVVVTSALAWRDRSGERAADGSVAAR